MSQVNPYAPPNAPVADVPAVAEVREAAFFAVSIPKLVLMSVCTLGFYYVYWFYRNWQLIAYQERLSIMPLMRGIFSIFFCYGCFRRIRDFQHPALTARSVPAGPLAAGYILTNLLLSGLPAPYFLVVFTSFLFLSPIQRRANEINAAVDPGHDSNARFSALNWVGLTLGGLFLIFVMIGTLVPAPE